MLGRQAFPDAINREVASRGRRFDVKRLSLLGLILIGLCGVLDTLWLSPQPKVMPSTADETVFLHPQATYQQAAAQLFASSIMNRNKLTVNVAGIDAALKQRFPELGVVSVSVPLFGHLPVVYIAPTDARLRLRTLSGKSYVVDDNGRAIVAVSSSDATAYSLPEVDDVSGTPVTIGQPIISSDTVTFIRTVAFQVTQQHLRVMKFTLPAGGSELDLYVNGQPYFVKFNLADDSALQQVGTYLAVLHRLTGEGKTPAQYIDVRLSGRAYYK